MSAIDHGLDALAADLERAEAILFALAAELRFVPLEQHSSRLHVRALELKRDVARWAKTLPAKASRDATIEELVDLHRTAESLRTARAPRWP